MTETDNRGCLNNPLGYVERVFEFMAMFGATTDILGIKVGHYTDKKAATSCTVIGYEQGAVAGVPVTEDVGKC